MTITDRFTYVGIEVIEMRTVFELLGLDRLAEGSDDYNQLCEQIENGADYIIPGYGVNYLHYEPTYGLEFELCESLNGDVLGVDIHHSGNVTLAMEYESLLSSDDVYHFYRVKHEGADGLIPVKIVCPDVLALPEKGDRIFGQAMLFGEEVISLPENGGLFVKEGSEGVIDCCTRIRFYNQYEVTVNGVTLTYWYCDLETSLGMMDAVIPCELLKDEPEQDQYIHFRGILALDVAIERDRIREQPYTGHIYQDVLPKTGRKFGDGFVPNRKNAMRVLAGCIKRGNYTRFGRCCAPRVRIIESDKTTENANTAVPKALKDYFGMAKREACVQHILRCEDFALLGHDVVAVLQEGEAERLVYCTVNEYGYVDSITLLDPCSFELGRDLELHALAMLENGLCRHETNLLREYLAEDCVYRSDTVDKMYIGLKKILEKVAAVSNAQKAEDLYESLIVPASDVLRSMDDLPNIYQGNWCSKEYQYGEIVAVIFIRFNEEGLINRILLSTDGTYLKDFDALPADQQTEENGFDLCAELERIYETKDILRALREEQTDNEDIIIWNQADSYARSWLRNNGYNLSYTEIEPDCIGYACSQRDKEYAVFFYARGEKPYTQLTAGYCQKLRDYPVSKDKTIIIVYVRVAEENDESGAIVYKVGSYYDAAEVPEAWLLERVEGKDILLFYPRIDVYQSVRRLTAAFNSQSLDLLRALCSEHICLETERGTYMNDGFYSYLSNLYIEHGKMKIAYVRYNDVLYSMVPLIENVGYIGFSVDKDNRIENIRIRPLSSDFRDLFITDEAPMYDPLNEVPGLVDVEFYTAPKESRYSVRMVFDNGETRCYDFVFGDIAEGLFEIGHHTFTEKIMRNGWLINQIAKPEWMGYRNYPDRGPGIAFANGYVISTAELYFGSYLVGCFDYSKLDGIHYIDDENEDGFQLGRIRNMNPENPLYLFDTNTKTAKELPEKYQETECCVYPFCGGYSEGLVMVSLLGDFHLKYHHNRMGCAGMWGWLDTDLNEVIEPQFIYAENFIDERAIVCRGEWEIEVQDGEQVYWCEDEKWGVINRSGEEIVPCAYDELYEVDGTDRYYFVHAGGWEKGNNALYDVEAGRTILDFNFDFDMGYMFNECFINEYNQLVMLDHQPGQGLDYVYIYDLTKECWIAYHVEYEERTYNGEQRVVVEKDGQEIIVF